MEIQHDERARRMDMFDDNGSHLGTIEYIRGGNNELYATHTEVFPPYEGKGYAKLLLNALTAYAKRNDLKIVAICPYVINAFQRYPEQYAAVSR